MKRWEIRKQLPQNISDAQLRKVIEGLGYSVEDSFSYFEEQVEEIKAAFSKSHPQNSMQDAEAEQEIAQIQLRSAAQESLDSLHLFVSNTQKQRSTAVVQVAHTIADLYNPKLFTAEVLMLAAQIIKAQPQGKPQNHYALFESIPGYQFPSSRSRSEDGLLPGGS